MGNKEMDEMVRRKRKRRLMMVRRKRVRRSMMVPKIVTLRLIVITPEEACKLCVYLYLCISTR